MSAPILRALRAAMLATLTLTTIALPIAVAAQCVDYADYQHGIDAWFAHNTALDAAEGGGFAYFAEAGAGVMVISIGDPLHPRSVATIDTPGLASRRVHRPIYISPMRPAVCISARYFPAISPLPVRSIRRATRAA
ncbi:MAG: hypothetical protein IPH86_16395 [bacterium]|nr:hypothetical protein [bacterium]